MKRDVVLCVNEKDEITGFSLGYVDDPGFIKPYYYGDIAYVKPQFRKGRTAYLLYNNVVDYADQLGLPLIAKAYVGDTANRVDKIQSKFGDPLFVEFHRIPEKKE